MNYIELAELYVDHYRHDRAWVLKKGCTSKGEWHELGDTGWRPSDMTKVTFEMRKLALLSSVKNTGRRLPGVHVSHRAMMQARKNLAISNNDFYALQAAYLRCNDASDNG